MQISLNPLPNHYLWFSDKYWYEIIDLHKNLFCFCLGGFHDYVTEMLNETERILQDLWYEMFWGVSFDVDVWNDDEIDLIYYGDR